MLFTDKEKCNYMIVYIRIFIAAYIKENRILYESFIFDEDLETFCLREVEAVDVECDNLQIIAVTNAFNIGVVIESLNNGKVETIKFPEDGKDIFINLLFRPGHYDILYTKEQCK
jgi:ubiquitin thioesterase protein OTUB1